MWCWVMGTLRQIEGCTAAPSQLFDDQGPVSRFWLEGTQYEEVEMTFKRFAFLTLPSWLHPPNCQQNLWARQHAINERTE